MNNTTQNDMNNASQTTSGAAIGDVEKNILLAFYSIVLVLTVFGNTLVCVAIYVDLRLRSPTNWFIASLAVSDLFYGLAGLPFRIANMLIPMPNNAVCSLWVWIDMICAAASMANLAVISVDRYLIITKPFAYHKNMTKRRSFGAIGGVWLYAATLASLSIIRWPGAGGVYVDPRNELCVNDNRVFYTVAHIVAFLVPLTVLCINYSMILRTAWIQFKKMQHSIVNTSSKEDKRKQKSVTRDFKATKTLAIVLLTFTICWAPFFITFTIHQYDPLFLAHLPVDLGNGIIYTVYFVLPNINSACNPVIYAYFNSEFRRVFKRLMFSACDKDLRNYGSRTKRKSSLTSFFQSTFVRRGSPPTPTDDGNHNYNHIYSPSNNHDENALFINGDTVITEV